MKRERNPKRNSNDLYSFRSEWLDALVIGAAIVVVYVLTAICG